MDEKKKLRSSARATRSEAFKRYGTTVSERLAEHGIGFSNPPKGASVSAFLAIGEELDLLPLMRRLWREGHTVGLPVMIGKDMPLEFRAWKEGEALGEAMWGIREPLPSAQVIEPDVLLVPLLAFDEVGYRLGYGGGFYDRSLERLKAIKPVITIGVAYDEQRVDAVPHNHYDVPLDWVLTQSGPVKCKTPALRQQ